jgi:hypothetical protein
MTQVVPEHLARAKLSNNVNNNNNNTRKETNSTYRNRTHRSIPATSSSISVTCDTDTSLRSSNTSHQQSSPSSKKPSSITKNHISTSHSSSALMNTTVHSPPTLFRNHRRYKSNGNSTSSMSTSLKTSSGGNIAREKLTLTSSISTISISNNRHLRKSTGAESEGAVGGTILSTKSLSNKHKSSSLDDDNYNHHRHHQYNHRTNQNRRIGKSVLEHLVFVFPENVRRILTGTKK